MQISDWFLSSPMYEEWAQKKVNKLEVLNHMSGSLMKMYTAKLQAVEWAGISHKASAFKVQLQAPTVALQATEQMSSNCYQKWWDSQICELPGCGGKHPTKFHYDLEARDRPRSANVKLYGNHPSKSQPKNETSTHQKTVRFKSATNQQQQCPRFKSDSDRNKFQKLVHKAALDYVVKEDHDLVANLAGGDVEEESQEEFEDAMQSEAELEAEALAAMSIESLLNW